MSTPEPMSPDEHERHLRALLSEFPDDANCILSLIAIVHLSGRPPFPDEEILASAAPWQAKTMAGDAVPCDLDELIAAAAKHAAAGSVWPTYTNLWQAVIRHPGSARPWAEYAQYLAKDSEWSYARAATQRALGLSSVYDPLTVEPLLVALATLAEEMQLGDTEWRGWFDQLPAEWAASSAALTLLLRQGDRAEVIKRLPEAFSRYDDDARTWLVASKVEYEESRSTQSYAFLRRAFELDFPTTLHSVVRQWSGPATLSAELLGQTDLFVDRLEELSANHPGVNLIPAGPSVDKLNIANRQRSLAIDRGLPSAFLFTMGKSGSVSVANILGSGFGLPTALYSWINLRVVPSWLRDYLRGGANYTTHLRPIDVNVDRLLDAGVKDVIVHVRDPRQVAVSLTHHVAKYPAYAKPEWLDREREGPEAMLDYVTDELLTESIGWIDGWYNAGKKINVHFTTFEEFISDRNAFCDRLVGLYGGDTKYFDRDAAFSTQQNTDYHIRLGETEEWRRVLSNRQIDHINAMIPPHYWPRFNWNP